MRKKQYCSYHNALTSTWENPQGVGEEVDNDNCEWCKSNRNFIEANGGCENCWEVISNKFIDALLKKKK